MGKTFHPWYDCIWDIKCHDKDGNLKWQEIGHNDLVDEGEESMLRTYFRNESAPTEFYVHLASGTITETDTMYSVLGEPPKVGEPGYYGYAPQLIERSAIGFPTIEMDASDWRVVSKAVTFTASGGSIGPVTVAYLATTIDNSGKLLAFKNLPISRTLVDGDTGTVTLRIKLQ